MRKSKKKMAQMNLFTKKTHRLKRMNLQVLGEEWGAGIVREFGMDMYTLLYLKQINNKDQLYTTGTLLNVMLQPGWEGCMLSHVRLVATPWTVAHQAPLYGIHRARILEWVAIPFSRGSS